MVIRYGDIQPYKYGGQPSARRSGRCNVGYQAGGNIQGPPSGNEKERMHGIGLYDSRARWYDPALGRTTTMDSEASTYPGMSPYLWCAANPVRYTDPSGSVIKLADDSSDSFKADYAVAYNYLKKHNASFVLDELDKRSTIFIIKEYADKSEFDSKTNTILWDSHRAKMTSTAYTLTPAELLSHEADHALEYDKDRDSAIERLNCKDQNYGNKDDKRVIEGSEQEVAKRLGRVQDFGVTRTDHYGISYYVVSADSDDVTGVLIVGTNKKDEE